MSKKPPPPRDEFDEIVTRAWAVPLGIFTVWVAVVRSWRAVKRRFSADRSPPARPDAQDWLNETRQSRWAREPQPLERPPPPKDR